MSIREFLYEDPFAEVDHGLTEGRVVRRLKDFLTDDVGDQLRALRPFVDDRPWRYWTDSTVQEALEILEADPERTYAAVSYRHSDLHRAIHALFHPSDATLDEGSLPAAAAQSYLRLAADFLPDYLRWAEHVWGNLLSLFWSVARSGGLDAKFRLRNAASYLRRSGHAVITDGYDESVRNAIAHGEVRFTGVDAEFGTIRPTSLSPSEFLDLHDRLIRTANALGLALLLFWLRNSDLRPEDQTVPLALAGRVAAGAVERPALEVIGVVESDTPLGGHQLHAAVRLGFRQREWVLGEASRVAARLIQAGAGGYDRYLIEVDHGEPVSSLVVIKGPVLESLIHEDADWTRLSEALGDTQLLWYNESAWRTRLRGWSVIVGSARRLLWTETVRRWHDGKLWLGKGRFIVREVGNHSIGGISRVKITAVLKRPSDAENRKVVNEVLHELIKLGRRRLVRSHGTVLDRGLPWPKRPVHILVSLFRLDGSTRWLKRSGWLGGNTVAIAERTWGGRDPVLVTNPELIYRGVRVRYNVDVDAVREAWRRVEKLSADVGRRRSLKE